MKFNKHLNMEFCVSKHSDKSLTFQLYQFKNKMSEKPQPQIDTCSKPQTRKGSNYIKEVLTMPLKRYE